VLDPTLGKLLWSWPAVMLIKHSEVSADATGNNFVAMQVVTQVPGQNGASGAKATDFPLVAAMCGASQSLALF
jgi:hypothetical protein